MPTFNISDLRKDVTIIVTIKERPQDKLRFWIGKKLLTLSIWIIGCRIEYRGMEDGD